MWLLDEEGGIKRKSSWERFPRLEIQKVKEKEESARVQGNSECLIYMQDRRSLQNRG